MKFTLEIELGNDAMQSLADVRGALSMVSEKLKKFDGLCADECIGESAYISDCNGNAVGSWEVTAE